MEKATIYNYARMCKTYDDCTICPLGFNNNGKSISCDYKVRAYPDKANEIILKWCKEHPVETRQSELLKAFPNVPIGFETVSICPLDFDKRFEVETWCHSYKDCTTCKKEYWLEEVDKNGL